MCNDFGNNSPYSDYLAAFSQICAPVVFPMAAPNLETAMIFARRVPWHLLRLAGVVTPITGFGRLLREH